MKLDSEKLRALSAVLRFGSFEAAAQELGVTQSAISQRIKLLEDTVGARLVVRDKPCIGTDEGRRLAAHALQVEALEAQLALQFSQSRSDSKIPVNIALTADSADTWLFDAFTGVDGFLFEFIIDNQDFSDELLRKGEVVGAVTANGAALPGCDCHSLGCMTYLATASPEFIARYFANGIDGESLMQAPSLRFNSKDKLQSQWIKRYFGLDISPPFHSIAAPGAYVKANLAGLGWGMQPVQLVAEHVAKGRLVPLLPNTEYSMPLYWQTSRIWRSTLEDLTKAICLTARKSLPQS